MRALERLATMIFAAFSLSALTPPARAGDIVSGPLVGHVTDHSARIWLQLSIAKTVTVEVYDDHDNNISAVSSDIEGPLPFVCDIPVNALEPNKTYRIVVKLNDQVVRPPGPDVVIRTAPAPGEEAAFTVAFGGGIDPAQLKSPAADKLFHTINDTKPRSFLFLGNIGTLPAKLDNFPTTRRKAVRFICEADQALRNQPALQPLLRTAACYGIYGEHDFGTTNANQDFVFAPESQSAFQRYWANPNWGTPATPGCYCNFTMGDADFFLLDDRMYRDSLVNNTKSMLGEAQMAWLKKGLSDSRATFKIIALAGNALANYPDNSWRAYQPEQSDFLKWISTTHIPGCLFIDGGGSRGLGELTVLPATPTTYPLLDLSCGALAWPKPLNDANIPTAPPNPDRSGPPILDNNFATLDFAGLREHRFVTLRLRDPSGKIQTEQTIFATQLK